jgi:mRNA interferase RelE/StbE
VNYTIEVERRAARDLQKNVAHRDRPRIIQAIDDLAESPRPRGCRKVRAAPQGTYRIQVGDYRIIYMVLDEERVVIIARVKRHSEDT